MNTELPKSKLGFLEGVRDIAALIVVLHHVGLAFFPAINYLDGEKIHLGSGELELMIELLGSFLLFSFLALAGNNKRSIVLHILVAAVILFTDRKFYSAFILGSLISKLFVNGFSFPKGWKGMVWKVVLLAIGIYFSSFPQGNYTQQTIWKILEWKWTSGYDLFHVLGAFCIMLVICFDKNFIKCFSIRPFRYLGKISFSFYLLHFPILFSLGCFVFQKLWRPDHYVVPVLVAFAVSMAATFVLSHFFYLFVDKKSIKFSERMGRFITGERND